MNCEVFFGGKESCAMSANEFIRHGRGLYKLLRRYQKPGGVQKNAESGTEDNFILEASEIKYHR